VLRTPCLARLTAFYRDAIGFQVAQHIPGVVSLLRHGAFRLQLWQSAQGPAACCIPLDRQEVCIFQLHARIARQARGLLGEAWPQLKPWGAWEFSLVDIEGNRLAFVQWAVGAKLPEPAAREQDLRPRPDAGG
jgi:hypothetical protein